MDDPTLASEVFVAVLVGVLVAAAAGPASLVVSVPDAKEYARWNAPSVSPTPATLEQAAFRELGLKVKGRLIWTSNRGGNHDIYEANLATGDIRRLTHHLHVDYFPRFSPDGRRISFLRTRRPWASFREGGASDVFLMNADGTGEQRIAERADDATWAPDGRSLIFGAGKNRIVRFDLASGTEIVLAEGDKPPTEGNISDPALSDHGLLAVTLRGVPRRRRGVGVIDLARGQYFLLSSNPSACQITWMPGGITAVWIEGAGRGGTRVVKGSTAIGSEEVLIDLPGPYSHEYFPKISPDGEWLTWAAAAEGHEHDRADYEIFAWRLGSPWSSAIRLTHSSANDRWPDLFPDN